MGLVVTGPAAADVEAIGDYIAESNPARAASFVRELWAACEELVQFPSAYPRLRTHRSRVLRQRMHGAYRIIFSVNEGTVEVLRVLHGARDYERLLFGEDE